MLTRRLERRGKTGSTLGTPGGGAMELSESAQVVAICTAAMASSSFRPLHAVAAAYRLRSRQLSVFQFVLEFLPLSPDLAPRLHS